MKSDLKCDDIDIIGYLLQLCHCINITEGGFLPWNMYTNSKQIKDLNLRAKTIKLFDKT